MVLFACAAAVAVALVAMAIAVHGAREGALRDARRDDAARQDRLRQINAINEAQCASLHNIYMLLQQTIRESDRRIDTIDYYRQHPAERHDAHAANAAILRRFRTPPCPQNIAVPTKPTKGG